MVIVLRLTLACLLFLSPNAFAANYTVHVLGAVGTPSTTAGINAAGDVAGLSGDTPWSWHAGATRFLELPTARFGVFRGIQWTTLGVDNAGTLESWSIDDENGRQVVRSDASGARLLNDMPLHTTFDTLTPQASFPNGQITGTYQDATTGKFGVFLSQGDNLLPFTLPGWTSARPDAVNALGWVAGSGIHNGKGVGFLLRSGNVSDLGAFYPALLNDKGNMVVNGRTVWIGNASLQIRPLPEGNFVPQTVAMNNSAQIVGMQGSVPFLWTPAGGTEPLLLDDIEWQILAVHGISDTGQIAADGQNHFVTSPHALILTPQGRFTPPGSTP